MLLYFQIIQTSEKFISKSVPCHLKNSPNCGDKPMIRKPKILITGLIILLSCQHVPITNRTQLHLIPESQLLALSFEAYDDFLNEHPVITGTDDAEMIKRVGKKIQFAVEKYMKERNRSNQLKNYEWEYNLIKDSLANAWAMPGGKIGVYTGILPVTRNDTGLAIVLGHEIAHAIANHGNERMSQALLVELGGVALSTALSKKPELTRKFALAAFGLGSEVGILLPYSRLQESEADHLGLIFAAIAGYNPNAAVPFWERMSQQGKVPVPEFLSTHPSNKRRIENIKKIIPDAMKYYKQ